MYTHLNNNKKYNILLRSG